MRSPWSRLKFLPDKYAPYGCHYSCALAQAIRNSRTGLVRGKDAERHAKAPYAASKYPHQVVVAAAPEIIPEMQCRALQWFFHQKDVKEEITCKDAERENKYCGIGA